MDHLRDHMGDARPEPTLIEDLVEEVGVDGGAGERDPIAGRAKRKPEIVDVFGVGGVAEPAPHHSPPAE